MFFPSIKWDLSSALIGIFGTYTLTSFVLFKYPTILHKKKTVAFLARHISHRGGGYLCQNNLVILYFWTNFVNKQTEKKLSTWKIRVPNFYEIINAWSIFVYVTGAGEGYENTMMAFRRLIFWKSSINFLFENNTLTFFILPKYWLVRMHCFRSSVPQIIIEFRKKKRNAINYDLYFCIQIGDNRCRLD